MRRFPIRVAILALVLLHPSWARAAEFKIEEVPDVASRPVQSLKPNTIIFSDHAKDELTDSGNGLMRFEDWARARPVQKQILSLYPAYQEPTVAVTVNGLTKRHKEKLHVYVVEARFAIQKPPASVDPSRYATLDLLQAIDPSIKHRLISPDQAVPNRDPEFAYNQRPQQPWCADPRSLCIESHYQLEGKLPTGIRLANKIEESSKKIAEFLEFQSELRALGPDEAARLSLPDLTGLSTPLVGAIEQNLFNVNQVIQAGKLLVVLQHHPDKADQTVATVFMAIAVETDVLEKKKEFERVPVLRNLVPAQVLMGHSSFNTGQSVSAGLPSYARNRIQALADLLQQR
jgi:hypothetical protein